MRKPKSTPASVALLDPPDTEAERNRDYSRLTHADTALILKLADDGRTQPEIAQLIGCHKSTVSRTLAEFADTRVTARRLLHRHAQTFTERVIADADVDQALEVLDRIGVAERRRDTTGTDTRVSIVIGMPQHTIGPDPVITLTPSNDKALSE